MISDGQTRSAEFAMTSTICPRTPHTTQTELVGEL